MAPKIVFVLLPNAVGYVVPWITLVQEENYSDTRTYPNPEQRTYLYMPMKTDSPATGPGGMALSTH